MEGQTRNRNKMAILRRMRNIKLIAKCYREMKKKRKTGEIKHNIKAEKYYTLRPTKYAPDVWAYM